jgi:DNA-binding NtrC family response regulator
MQNLTTKPQLLIVDDDELIVDAMAYFLGPDFSLEVANSRPQAVGILRRGVRPHVALIDLGLPPVPHRPDEGFALIHDILAHSPETRIIVLSGQADEANARHARALGATEFVAKPANPESLRGLLLSVLGFQDVAPADLDGLIGKSAPMTQLRLQIRQFAKAQFPVLIEGESGSGKELVAAALFQASDRSNSPYLALNCASIAPSLVEATLFGHSKGAFTGAAGARSGYFEDAADGFLFLDEIGELPLELQPKLLRVLENGEYQRVGETQTRHSSARILAATNRDLRREAREGNFRADLYHRLSVLSISVPPLRELDGDRFLLLEHFKAIYAQQAKCTPFRLSTDADNCFREYTFPGNVRELRNIAIRLTAKFAGQQVERQALEAELDIDVQIPEIDSIQIGQTTNAAKPQRTPEDWINVARTELETCATFNLDERLRQREAAYIEAAQLISDGNLSKAARLLGINRTTLYNRIETLAREARRKS